MSKINKKIAKKYRYLFYITLSISVFSGSGFWLLRKFGMVEGDFGPESHFLQYPFLQLHGFAAFIMLMALGAIFTSHIPNTWYQKIAKKTGLTLLSFIIFSLISAYSLYYLVGQNWHEFLGNLHAAIGLLLPILLFVHIRTARKSRSNKKHKYAKKARKKQLK